MISHSDYEHKPHQSFFLGQRQPPKKTTSTSTIHKKAQKGPKRPKKAQKAQKGPKRPKKAQKAQKIKMKTTGRLQTFVQPRRRAQPDNGIQTFNFITQSL